MTDDVPIGPTYPSGNLISTCQNIINWLENESSLKHFPKTFSSTCKTLDKYLIPDLRKMTIKYLTK